MGSACLSFLVLILVLMEYALREVRFSQNLGELTVLILVLMEYALRDIPSEEVEKLLQLS